jgi:hypothetical protein
MEQTKQQNNLGNTIKIFIAGSTKLNDERDQIILLSNVFIKDRNYHNTTTSFYSYKDFSGDQEKIDNFIKNNADIVIFVLDDKMKSGTDDEFILASDTFKERERPKILVYLHENENVDENDKPTPEIAYIQGIMRGALGKKYYSIYSNHEELKNLVKEDIIKYLKEKDNIENSSHEIPIPENPKPKPIDPSPKRTKQWIKWLEWLLLALTIVALGVFAWNQKNKPLLIFAGGGSAANYLKDIYSEDVKSYHNSIYLNLPTGAAWTLLPEEANRRDYSTGKQPFMSICLSADSIDSTFYSEKTRNLFSKARIVSYYLGEDQLVVYASKSIASSWVKDSIITVEELVKLINSIRNKTTEARIFTTSKDSGTLRVYQRWISTTDTEEDSTIILNDMIDKEVCHIYISSSSDPFIHTNNTDTKLPFIVLGSKHYKVEALTDYMPLYVMHDNHPVSKPMYINFVAYIIDDNYCNVSQPIVDLLKRLEADKIIDKETWNDILRNRIKPTKDEKNIILPRKN